MHLGTQPLQLGFRGAQLSELAHEQIPLVLELVELGVVDLADVVAVLAAVQGLHEVHCGLVGVVGSLVHVNEFEYMGNINYCRLNGLT